MLLELHVRDFAIIESARLAMGEGMIVLTGETGAGKSILVDAVGLLLGARGDPGAVRAGADKAVIQGVFAPPADEAAALLEELGAAHDRAEPLIVDREVHASGRTVARLNGHTVTVRDLARLASLLVDVHGQMDTAALRRESEQMDLLDRYAGLEAERAAFGALFDRLRAVQSEAESLRVDDAALARRADMLAFQVAEITDAGLDAAEKEDLLAERLRLKNAERLALLAAAAQEALRGSDEMGADGAMDQLDRTVRAVADIEAIDPSLAGLHDGLADATEIIRDAAREIANYSAGLEFEPGRLDEVESRLGQYADLERKYGGSVEAVGAWAERTATELDSLQKADERLADLAAEEAALRHEMAPLATTLSERRRAAGERLAAAAALEAADLGLPATQIAVALEQTEEAGGLNVGGTNAGGTDVGGMAMAFDRRGIDRVRFDLTTNPGEPLRPLAKIASGGEAARLMLALKSVLGQADPTPTLIFDEVDSGVGGRVGAAVGRKLWQLSRAHQVVCVTHLPQVAAYADEHIHVQKGADAGRTVTTLAALDRAGRAAELTQMLGTTTDAGHASAVELIDAAEEWKQTHTASK